jgi:hypothetical protein
LSINALGENPFYWLEELIGHGGGQLQPSIGARLYDGASPPPPPKLTVPVATLMMEKHGVDLALCSKCKNNKMETVATYRRGILCAIVASKADYQPSIAAKNMDSPNP